MSDSETARTRYLPKQRMPSLFERLKQDGYSLVGPTIDQEAIVYGELDTVDDLPRGWTDRQEPAKYRLERRDDDAWFGFVVGPHAWKKYLFPSHLTVSEAHRSENGWRLTTPTHQPIKRAFIGVRACELAAIGIQDRVFMGGPYVDGHYAAQRSAAFIVAVNCTQAASTCFCTSMKTGPQCRAGFDLALTELPDGFCIESGTEAGESILSDLDTTEATDEQLDQAAAARQQAVDQISKHMQTDGLQSLLMSNLEHPHWDEVAARCLGCTNCTMVCPTCFCCSVSDVSDLTGEHVTRERHWDSCFNLSFTHMSHETTRHSIKARYRQWLTHKLATWHDQFGTSGCVGCGRCITWCPVGIDLTEEVRALRMTNDQVAMTNE